ncbi:MAG: flagellar hook-basal body complex protein FliE, partial [Pseudomonadales bacterium]|nr:flagellar hook-basal body complex protein FliE [Pseudomonadales bacterium]
MSSTAPLNRPDIAQVLNEMRALKTRAQGFEPAQASADVAGSAPARGVEFQALLAQAVDQVNSVQKESGQLAESFQMGDPNVTLSQVVIASEKA